MWFQLLVNAVLTEQNRITSKRNGNLPFMGHKRMFPLKFLILVLLSEVLICFNWLPSTLPK